MVPFFEIRFVYDKMLCLVDGLYGVYGVHIQRI
jgi:hypothetical protein